LRAHLDAALGATGGLIDSRPGLASGSVVFVDQSDARAMDRTIRLIDRALRSAPFRDRVHDRCPSIARLERAPAEGILGFDFHLGEALPKLIEINTNPGGLLINHALAGALAACCDCLGDRLDGLAAGRIPLDDLPARVVALFGQQCPTRPTGTSRRHVVIVDDEPTQQYLYPEFLLYRALFESAGWHADIVDPQQLQLRDARLWLEDEPVDLVYNRLTDFHLDEPRHAILRLAHESGAAVLTPDPAAHARWADKRLLVWLRDESLLAEAGLDAGDRQHLLRSIPATEIVTGAASADLWRRRKQLFFKPVDGYGSKAAYRGDKLTRATFERILATPYVAQALAPTSMRRVEYDGQQVDLRVDVRNYTHDGETWLRAARLYRGQATNFRTPGGGFAPVLTLREGGERAAPVRVGSPRPATADTRACPDRSP
jgi:glutathione synthase/RimK-type ligase-like ATP-grasp enzyme